MYEYDPAAVLARSRRKRSVTGHYSPRRVGYDSTPILSLSAGAGHGSLEREKTLISSGTTTHASSPAFRCLLPGGVVSRSRRGIQYFFDSDNWNRNIRSEMSMRVIKKAELVVAHCSIISHAWGLLPLQLSHCSVASSEDEDCSGSGDCSCCGRGSRVPAVAPPARLHAGPRRGR